jgi:hypothetical protein
MTQTDDALYAGPAETWSYITAKQNNMDLFKQSEGFAPSSRSQSQESRYD